MSDVERWLESIGLGQYAELFAENDIDLDILPDVTDAELKELGLSLGDRKRLLKAVGALGEQPAPASARATAPPAPQSERSTEAERRQLTVMFCDLVGSTALSQKLDPEDFREIIRSFQETCTRAVQRHGGYVAKHLGDGLLAYFGYPQAQEDDAERAVRAALSIMEAVSGLDTPEPLELRAGIETGLVVVGDMVSEGMSQASEITGDTPNLAARLQQIAAPGQVVVGPTLRRLLGGAFDFEDLGPKQLKGITEPVRAAHVVGEVRRQSRFEARHAGGLTVFIGREAELDTLLRRWQEAKDGEGQVVLISGEPGIGKSRLTQELRERIADEPHIRLRYQCSPHHTNSALYPLIQQLTFAAGIEDDELAAAKLDKLEGLILQGGGDVGTIALLFADLLSIPQEGRYPPLNYSPQRQREETLNALMDQFTGLSSKQPVLAIYEDVHWVDPTTQELLDMMVAGIAELQALALITFRPEYEAPWVGAANVTALPLNRLGKRMTAQITANVAGRRTLPVDVISDIVAKTEGVPLFAEELTKAVLEVGPSAPNTSKVSEIRVPATLKDSLAARLDRLGSAREVAQIGAIIGRAFSHDLIAAVSDTEPEALDNALHQLVSAELLFQRGAPPDASYTFKHALIQDAAYESLLKSRRKVLHAGIAETLEHHFHDTVETAPELLAHHYTEAGSAERAIEYWRRAGELAGQRSANPEAISHLTRALELLRGLPETPERTRIELDLHLRLGPALMLTKGIAAPEVERTYLRARELCRQVGETERLFTVTWGLWLNNLQSARFGKAKSLAKEVLDLAQRQSDPSLLLQGHHAAWTTDLIAGELSSCREKAERGIALYDIEVHRSHAVWYGGHDPGVCAHIHAGMALWFLGYPDQALKRAEEAVSLAQRLEHRFSTILSFLHLSHALQLRGDFRRVQKEAEALSALSTEEDNVQYSAAGIIMAGWAIAAKGESETGIAEIRRGLLAYEATGARARRSYYLSLLADAYRRTSQVTDGLDTLAEALEITERFGEHRWEAELHRLKGELYAQRASVNEAKGCFDQAIAVARLQGAMSLELRAAASLARLWHDQGKTKEARDLLAPTYNWFTEGFDTPDLKEAKALLEELA